MKMAEYQHIVKSRSDSSNSKFADVARVGVT